jgi:hypothetical protein
MPYKAASAGADVKLVDARGTSQTRPDRGTTKAKTLSPNASSAVTAVPASTGTSLRRR